MTHAKTLASLACLLVALGAFLGAGQIDGHVRQRFADREATFHAALEGDARAAAAMATDRALAPFAALVPNGGVPAYVAAEQAHALKLIDAAFRGDRTALRALRGEKLVSKRLKALAAYPPSNALSRNLALKAIHAMLLDARPELVTRLESPASAKVHEALASQERQALASPAVTGSRTGLWGLSGLALLVGAWLWRPSGDREHQPGEPHRPEQQPTEELTRQGREDASAERVAENDAQRQRG